METSERLVYCTRHRADGIVSTVNDLVGKSPSCLEGGEIVKEILNLVNVVRVNNQWYAFVWVRVRRDD